MARILVVEDEIVAAQSIQIFLEESEHTLVAIVDTGLEAIQQAIAAKPDLVLMDIYLRGELDGIATADRISQELALPIIYLSASTEDATLQRAIATEPFGYLVKPFNQTQLRTVINIALHRHHLEKQLEHTEQWLATTLNSIGDGTIATDKQGHITFMNPIAETLTGWKQAEAIGASVRQVLQLVHPDTYEPIENPLLSAIQAGTHTNLPEQCILRTKDGMERAIRDTAAPIRNNKGEITGGVLVFQDITERKRSEELLYRREQEFRALVEHSPDIIARYDRQLRHLYVNPSIEHMTGIPVPAFIGKTNRQLAMPEIIVNDWEATLRAVFANGEERTIEFDTMTIDGLRYFQARIVPEFAPDGSVASVLSVARDITDRKQVEEALRLQAEREQLLGDITQRIRESLELEHILNTTVQELRHILQADRVVVYRFEPNWSGFVIVEALGNHWTPMLGLEIYDPCLATEDCILPFTRGEVGVIHDVLNAGLAACYVELLTRFQIRANLVIPILHGQRLWGLLSVQQCANPRIWQDWEVDFLSRLSSKLSLALQQSQLYQQTQLQAQRQQALNRLIQAVRNSLDLNTIFETAVTEMGTLLQVDQANILQYLPDQGTWVHVATYCRNPTQTSLYRGLEIPDADNPHTAQLKQGKMIRVDDVSGLEGDFSQILAATFPGAWLGIPLQINGVVWGNIGLIRHAQPFVWQDWQVQLTTEIADQLAIAIYQSQLYTEVQRLNAELESQVLERTALLQRTLSFEALLKRITDKVRDSLDENQILQVAVDELGKGLGIEHCGAALYSPDLTLAVITHEFRAGPPLETQNPSFRIADEVAVDVYNQLFEQQYCQFCLRSPNPLRPTEENRAILACPMWDDKGVLGDLWLFRHPGASFDEIEIRLVEQVANQCAIALRQSRLFQATQAQVIELERLNQLKDAFLSTISHELRTPMASIKMAIQMMEIALKPLGLLETEASSLSRYFTILQTQCDREIELIDNLLNLSQLEAETEPLLLSTINPTLWISHAIEPFFDRLQEQQQHLILDLAEGLPTLQTDLSCLGRILSELLTNACKYSPAGSTIRVFARMASAGLQVGITNTGIEIPATEIPRIFEQFYRIPNHDPWRYGGTGIGLTLVKRLVDHIGATIDVVSHSGETSFILTFPTIRE